MLLTACRSKFTNVRDCLTLSLFLILAFVMPLHDRLVVFVIAMILINWLIDKRLPKKIKNIFQSPVRRLLLSFSFIYLLYWIGLFYSDNRDYGFFDLEVKMSLLIFPLIFATIDDRIFKDKKIFFLFYSFIAGCIVSTFIFLFYSTISFLESNALSAFYYKNLSLSHHPSYFSMYLNLSIAFLLFFLIEKKIQLSGWLKVTAGILILYFFIIIILLSSKAGILSLLMVLFISTGYLLVFKKRYLAGAVLIVLITASFIGSFYIFTNTTNRFLEAKESVVSEGAIENDTKESSGERILVWKSTIDIIRHNFLFGVGTGDVKDQLLKKYKEENIVLAMKLKLNAHNQYLQTFLSIGVIGFWVLALYILLPMINAMKNRNLLYFLFLAIIGFNFLFESMLERQAGVVFYAFFNAYLFAVKKEFRSSSSAPVLNDETSKT
ncbi:MAG: O-antigen ligase family protein [Bacteroidales bacterium]|nr:O-antigen ligase family protein [Bacteroidales bacterium]